MSTIWLKDAAERVIATYLQAFMGLVTADLFGLTGMDSFKAAAIAAIPAALSAAKAAIAVLFGDPESASLVRTVRDTVNC